MDPSKEQRQEPFALIEYGYHCEENSPRNIEQLQTETSRPSENGQIYDEIELAYEDVPDRHSRIVVHESTKQVITQEQDAPRCIKNKKRVFLIGFSISVSILIVALASYFIFNQPTSVQELRDHHYSTGYYGFDDQSKLQARFLAPVKIRCPPQQLLQGFKFEQKKEDDVQMNYLFQYTFTCIDSKVRENTTVKNEWTLMGSDLSVDFGSIHFLDRQEINCTSRGYLTNFRVELQVGSTNLRYVYECGKPFGFDDYPNGCVEKQTDLHESQNFSILSLEDHNVKCNSNEALNSFKWSRIGQSRLFQYIYTCCNIQ